MKKKWPKSNGGKIKPARRRSKGKAGNVNTAGEKDCDDPKTNYSGRDLQGKGSFWRTHFPPSKEKVQGKKRNWTQEGKPTIKRAILE